MGHRRPPLPLGHHPRPHREPRLRLAPARHLWPPRRRRRLRRPPLRRRRPRARGQLDRGGAGLGRCPLLDLVRWLMWLWPLEVAVMLWPTGMVSVITGTIDDGYNGILGWMWIACAITTIGLVFVTRAALKERQYSAVMAATGLL